VLVASDDAWSRALLERELGVLGYQVTQVNDGAQVLEALAWAVDGRGSWPDVLLLDLRSSPFGGLDVLSALRDFAEVPPTVLVSVLGDRSVDVTVSTFRANPNARGLEVNAVLAAVLATACKQQVARRVR
jgi:CheY-like chemotaxis protein